jgi:hypothetical protein
MKKLTIIILVCCALISYAQIPKGTILAGATSNLGFSNYKPDGGSTSTGFNINVKGGYFIIDNLVAGANLGLSRSDAGTTTFTANSIGLFARYYIIGKIFVGGGFDAINTRSESGTFTNKTSYVQGNFNAGYALFLNPNIAVEPTLNINNQAGDVDAFSVGLGVGFTLFLNRK